MVLSVIPGEDLPSLSIWQPDKVMHAFVYATLTFFMFKTLRAAAPDNRPLKTSFIAGGLCILYGFFIELIQLALPTRSFDLLDELANSIGCSITIVLLTFARLAVKKS